MSDLPLTDAQFYVNFFIAASILLTHFTWGSSKNRRASIFLLGIAVIWLLWTILLGSRSEIRFRDALVSLISYGAILFVVLSDQLIGGGAAWLTRKRGEKWTKEIDYFYLGLGAVGLGISLGQLNIVSDRLQLPGTLASVSLATALVLRAIKTRAEIAGWNKLPPAAPRLGPNSIEEAS